MNSSLFDWQTANQEYLAIALGEVQIWLEQYVSRRQSGYPAGQKLELQPELLQSERSTSESLAELAATMESELSAAPALETLCHLFHLTAFERSVLLLCAGVELSAAVAQACAAAQGSAHLPYVTFSLALAALPEAHWDALSPIAPLRNWNLIEIDPSVSLTQSRLRIDERILHYLMGISYLDQRLRGWVKPLQVQSVLAPSQQAMVTKIVEYWSASQLQSQLQSWPIVQLSGVEATEKMAIATAACYLLGIPLYMIRAQDLPTAVTERETLSRLWQREVQLTQSALAMICDDLDHADRLQALSPWITELQGRSFLFVREPLLLNQQTAIRLQVEKPSPEEQWQLWQTALGPLSSQLNVHLTTILAQFNFNAAMIQTVGTAIQREPDQVIAQALPQFLWETCRIQARTQLGGLAQRIEPSATWSDLVLPAAQLQILQEIVAQVRQRSLVYDTWEFALRGSNGLGITSLFAGASGTGKTLAAEVIAHELQLDLYRIDLSQAVSKYIGETEKNLRQVFDAAESGGAILLFDEADALFGKRSDVKDSHDRYANIEVSYLLQRMEAYRGLAILTTNLKQAIDSAFLRRIRFVVQFPFPDTVQRMEIWQRMFPAKLPTQALDFARLARLQVVGGNIRNIALNAAFLAADRGEAMGMAHLLQAARSEYAKLEKNLTEAEVGGWV